MPTSRLRQIGFLLVPGFSLLSYASTIEPLRAANRLSGRTLYEWCHISTGGESAISSSGLAVTADHKAGDDIDLDSLFVCAGGNPALFRQRRTLAWLRQLSRRGVAIGGVSGGPYILARAGLLDGYRCTIDWEHMAAFREEFPDLEAHRTLYEIDRDRLTCAGGIAALDMMRAIIGSEHGPALATAVSGWFLQTHLRLGSGPQRLTLRERFGTSNRTLLKALEAMESSTESPMSRKRLSQHAGVSIRQLERLFSTHLNTTIGAQYLNLRLERARRFLAETTIPILAVAVACGFVSASHFSRSYKKLYGMTPKEERDRRDLNPTHLALKDTSY